MEDTLCNAQDYELIEEIEQRGYKVAMQEIDEEIISALPKITNMGDKLKLLDMLNNFNKD